MKHNSKAISVVFTALLLTTLTTAIDINSSEGLQYYNNDNLEFQVDGDGNADILGSLDVSGNSINNAGELTVGANGILNSDSYAKLETGGGGSSSWSIYDSANSQHIAYFNEGGKVEIPNGNLNVDGNSITNFFGNPCASGNLVADIQDSGTLSCSDVTDEVSDDYVSRSGDTMSGTLTMSSNNIADVGSGNIQIGDGAGDINMNGNQIYGASLSQSNFVGVTSKSTATTEKSNMQDYSAYVQNDLKVGGDIIGSGGDVAENVENQTEMEPGTVATISGKFEVEPSSEKRDTGVAGVVSTDPGVTLKKERDGVPLALSGIVPVKATAGNGDISPGDLMTTSDREGYAMKCEDSLECHGAVIGKAMGSLDKTGKVQMLVTLG